MRDFAPLAGKERLASDIPLAVVLVLFRLGALVLDIASPWDGMSRGFDKVFFGAECCQTQKRDFVVGKVLALGQLYIHENLFCYLGGLGGKHTAAQNVILYGVLLDLLVLFGIEPMSHQKVKTVSPVRTQLDGTANFELFGIDRFHAVRYFCMLGNGCVDLIKVLTHFLKIAAVVFHCFHTLFVLRKRSVLKLLKVLIVLLCLLLMFLNRLGILRKGRCSVEPECDDIQKLQPAAGCTRGRIRCYSFKFRLFSRLIRHGFCFRVYDIDNTSGRIKHGCSARGGDNVMEIGVLVSLALGTCLMVKWQFPVVTVKVDAKLVEGILIAVVEILHRIGFLHFLQLLVIVFSHMYSPVGYCVCFVVPYNYNTREGYVKSHMGHKFR